MNPTRTSVVTALGVTFAALSVVYGSFVRDSLTTGGSFDKSLTDTTPGLEASTKQIPEDDFYRGLVTLLKREYVEPITDERKLAIGAVKGMVQSLDDPRSNYMSPDEFRVFTNATEGKYEGIGVDLEYTMGRPHAATDDLTESDLQALAIPRLRVAAVTPGGPADRAGVKPGDVVDTVEGHWVLNPGLVEQVRDALETLTPAQTKGLTPAQLKARQDHVEQLGRALKVKLDTMIMPARAKDMLQIGTSGAVHIVWDRGATQRSTNISRKDSQVPDVEMNGDTVTVRFAQGAAEKLRRDIAGKSDVTIDLRDNSNGDFDAMQECLAAVAPSGTYGYIHSDKPGKSRKFSVANGNDRPPQMTILVDPSTSGAADVFAAALSYRHLAKIQGALPKDRSVVEVVPLPDGSGYTLVTGEYVTKLTPPQRLSVRSEADPTPVAMREADGSIVAMGDKKGGNA